MGGATSSQHRVAVKDAFTPFSTWTTVQMNDLLLRYTEMDLDFGLSNFGSICDRLGIGLG